MAKQDKWIRNICKEGWLFAISLQQVVLGCCEML
jgi:hypothetical protein